jgi:hypothetical protein
MWRVYAAWMEGAVDADIEAIKDAMQARHNTNGPSPAEWVAATSRVKRARNTVFRIHAKTTQWIRRARRRRRFHLALDLPLAVGAGQPSPGIYWEMTGGADGTRTRDPRRDRPVF